MSPKTWVGRCSLDSLQRQVGYLLLSQELAAGEALLSVQTVSWDSPDEGPTKTNKQTKKGINLKSVEWIGGHALGLSELYKMSTSGAVEVSESTSLKQLAYLPEDGPLSISGISWGCDDPECGSETSVCQDSSPGLLATPQEAQTALKTPGGLQGGAVGRQKWTVR